MLRLTAKYRPITAAPFERSETYSEIAPCDALRPYIRCFWGTPEPVVQSGIISDKKSLVIPDTCMDIIFHFDYTNNLVDGHFCTIDENSYLGSRTANSALTSTFAIRFYAWTAVLFAENSFVNSKNKVFAAEDYFSVLKKELLPMLTSVSSLDKRSELAGEILLKRLNKNRINSNLMNGIWDIISMRGTAKISDIAQYNALSKKHLERVFNENMGISPKAFSSLVRYQMLWQEACFSPCFNVHDAVEKYGYSDQSHLLNEFKKRHSMTPKQAVEFAGK